jgi:ATP-dependent helicase/nuclease subunit A
LSDDFNEAANPADEGAEGMILRFSTPQTAKPVPDAVRPLEKERVVGIPSWARTPPKETQAVTDRFRPSDYESTNENFSVPSPLEGKAESYFMSLGTVVHGLFEFLPALPPEERAQAAEKYLAKPVWELKERDQKQTLKQVLAVLSDPEFGALFGPNSRPEVSVTGYIEKDGEKQMLTAQIDRLVVEDDTVMIVDYKNSREIPKDASEVPYKYIVQMAAYKMAVQQIYPDKEIKCALLFTRKAVILPLNADVLDKALQDVKLKPHVPKKPEAPKI